jgi:hypothetical protein
LKTNRGATGKRRWGFWVLEKERNAFEGTSMVCNERKLCLAGRKEAAAYHLLGGVPKLKLLPRAAMKQIFLTFCVSM